MNAVFILSKQAFFLSLSLWSLHLYMHDKFFFFRGKRFKFAFNFSTCHRLKLRVFILMILGVEEDSWREYYHFAVSDLSVHFLLRSGFDH